MLIFWHTDKLEKYKNEDTKSRFSAGNCCSCNRGQIFRSRAVSTAVQNYSILKSGEFSCSGCVEEKRDV